MIIENLDKWDRREFMDIMEYDQSMSSIEKQGSTKTPNYAEFMTDIFGGLYKYAPKARDPESAPSNEKWADQIFDEVSKLPEWHKLRERTIMNAEAAASATTEFCQKFMDAVPDQTHSHQQQLSKEQLSKVRNRARIACESAVIVADQTNETIEAFGYGQGNQTSRAQFASPNTKKEIAKRLIKNETLRKIAEMAGRFKRIAVQKQKSKTKHGVDEVANITVGDNLSRLIPAELMQIGHPLLKIDFRRKFLEQGLLQYELKGKHKEARGPIVMCVDESGSMAGQRDIWAKAVAMAMLQIAVKQKREFYLIHFSRSVYRTDHFKYPVQPAELLDAMSFFCGGGTNFMEPLSRAIEIIAGKSGVKSLKNADIILVSDGDATIQTDWLKLFTEAKKRGQINVISVMIGQNDSVCKLFSDHLFYIDDLTKSDDALSTMFSV